MNKLFETVCDWPKTIILMVITLTMLLASQMQYMKIDTDTEAFIPPGHQATLNNDRMKDLFGTPDFLWIGILSDEGVYHPDTLVLLQSLTEKVRLVPGVIDQDVVSISTEDNIRGTADGMEVEPFLDGEVDEIKASKIRDAIRDFDMYDGFIVARDGSAAAILAELETTDMLEERGLDKFQVYQAVQSIVEESLEGRAESFHISGVPVAEATLGKYIQEDMNIMLPLVFAVLMIILFFTYHSVRGVLIPMSVVMFSVLAALGIMAAVGVPMYPTTTMVPVTLMAIGVADAIHILGKYYEVVLVNPNIHRREAVLATMNEMWRPVVLTSFTTAVGFLSFLTMEMVPLKMMGVFAAVGIIYAMFVSLTLVPAMLTLLAVKAPKKLIGSVTALGLEHAGLMSRCLSKLGVKVSNNSENTLLAASVILFVLAIGASQVYVEDSYMANFQEDSELVRADTVINEKFIGSYQRNLLLEAKDADAFYNPELLNAVWLYQQEAEKIPGIGGTISVSDFIRRMNRVMNEDRPEMAKIPDSSNLIAQYFLLYSFSGAPDDFSEVVDSEYRMANVRIFGNSDSFIEGKVIESELERLAIKYFSPLDVTWSMAGNAHIGHMQTQMITDNLRINILTTVLAIFLFAWAMMRSLVAGLFVMVPVLAAVILNFAIMGVFGITIGWGSSMFTSIAICIGVDYAIHLIYKFQHEYALKNDSAHALTLTLATTGKTILFNAVVVIAGFMVLLASQMPPNQQMGALVAAAMFSSFAATLIVLPALILTARPKFIYGSQKVSEDF
ncbi:MAG: MMPL family transporter [Mariprofundaceae bacterium]